MREAACPNPVALAYSVVRLAEEVAHFTHQILLRRIELSPRCGLQIFFRDLNIVGRVLLVRGLLLWS